MSNEKSRSFGFVGSIKIAFCAERGYYISELTPNLDMIQPSMLTLARLIYEFNCLMETGMTIEQNESEE